MVEHPVLIAHEQGRALGVSKRLRCCCGQPYETLSENVETLCFLVLGHGARLAAHILGKRGALYCRGMSQVHPQHATGAGTG